MGTGWPGRWQAAPVPFIAGAGGWEPGAGSGLAPGPASPSPSPSSPPSMGYGPGERGVAVIPCPPPRDVPCPQGDDSQEVGSPGPGSPEVGCLVPRGFSVPWGAPCPQEVAPRGWDLQSLRPQGCPLPLRGVPCPRGGSLVPILPGGPQGGRPLSPAADSIPHPRGWSRFVGDVPCPRGDVPCPLTP